MHPKLAVLIEYSDGESGAWRCRWVGWHVARCARCRDEIQRIREEKAQFAGHTGSAAGLDRGLAAVLSSMTAWRGGHPQAAQAVLKNRVLAQTELFFGASAANAIERERTVDLLSRARGLFDAFLGAEAAGAMQEQIVSGNDCTGESAEACQ
jgi:hypothetical protein